MTKQPPGRWLEQKLGEAGLSVHDVMAACGIKVTSTVYRWFSGKSVPADEHAAKLAEMLDVPELEVRYRFGMYIPRAVVEEAQWRREVVRLAELVAEDARNE